MPAAMPKDKWAETKADEVLGAIRSADTLTAHRLLVTVLLLVFAMGESAGIAAAGEIIKSSTGENQDGRPTQ